jgi:hypothetical protein
VEGGVKLRDRDREMQSVVGQDRMRFLWALITCALWIPISAWIGQEISGLVYTVEEVDLLSLEKHISVWKVDLEESRGGNRKLEVLLAQRLMRESSLLMNTLRAYAGGVLPDEKSVMVVCLRGRKWFLLQGRRRCLLALVRTR